jgi:hypothetical protein
MPWDADQRRSFVSSSLCRRGARSVCQIQCQKCQKCQIARPSSGCEIPDRTPQSHTPIASKLLIGLRFCLHRLCLPFGGYAAHLTQRGDSDGAQTSSRQPVGGRRSGAARLHGRTVPPGPSITGAVIVSAVRHRPRREVVLFKSWTCRMHDTHHGPTSPVARAQHFPAFCRNIVKRLPRFSLDGLRWPRS